MFQSFEESPIILYSRVVLSWHTSKNIDNYKMTMSIFKMTIKHVKHTTHSMYNCECDLLSEETILTMHRGKISFTNTHIWLAKKKFTKLDTIYESSITSDLSFLYVKSFSFMCGSVTITHNSIFIVRIKKNGESNKFSWENFHFYIKQVFIYSFVQLYLKIEIVLSSFVNVFKKWFW